MENTVETNARKLVADYVNFGNEQHFKLGGNMISALFFKREQLYKLVSGKEQELFIMLALNNFNSPDKYLDIVLASQEHSSVNMTTLLVNTTIPYTGQIIIPDGTIVKSVLDRVRPEEVRAMRSSFQLSAANTHLVSSQGYKIKCYTVNKGDLNCLTLRDKLNDLNRNDDFIFMPVIRPIRTEEPQSTPFDQPHLSFAIARAEKSGNEFKVIGTIIEYCLPCPTACATNYWFK